ncbi:transposase [Streptomyces rimosus]|uniref:transposase n=1 Tax=Streptomyces rimosus TaxID=1927 RepID=UPI003CD013B5
MRAVVEQLVEAGQWKPGDPHVLVALDAGYDAPRIAHLLADLPVEILGRLRSDRVMRRPAPFRKAFALANPLGGRPPKHGGEFVLGNPSAWGVEQAATVTETRLYGKATARVQDRLHPSSPGGRPGSNTTALCPSSRAPSSVSPWRSCRPAV